MAEPGFLTERLNSELTVEVPSVHVALLGVPVANRVTGSAC